MMDSKYVASLNGCHPTDICMVDYDRADAVYLYLGDDVGDHTTRIGFYRVRRDGRAWMNQDLSGSDERWLEIE